MNAEIKHCIDDHILEEFLKLHCENIVMKNILEFDEKVFGEAMHDAGFEEGYEKARQEDAQLLSEKDAEIARLREQLEAALAAKQ